MSYDQLVALYFERASALQNYWTLYVVIIGGLLAVSSLRQIPNRLTTVLVTVLFLSFAYKNCGAIVDVTRQREAARQAMDAVAAETPLRQAIEPTMAGTTESSARRFHVFCDALTVLTLWSMEWRRRRRAAELARDAGR